MSWLLERPVRDHDPVGTTPGILDDIGISRLLNGFFQDPAKHLTFDPNVLKDRNSVLRILLESPGLERAAVNLNEQLSGLEGLVSGGDSDPFLTLSGQSVFGELHSALNAFASQCKIPPDDAFRRSTQRIEQLISRRFPDDFETHWRQFADGLSRPGAVRYRFYLDRSMHITRVSVLGIDRVRFHKRLFPRKGNRLVPLLPQNKPAYHLEAGDLRTPEILLKFKAQIDSLLPEQIAASRQKAREFASALLGDLSGLRDELIFLTGAVRLIRELETKGISLVFAEPCPPEQRLLCADGAFHPADAANKTDIQIRTEQEILVGSTRMDPTLRTAGVLQFLFQMGLPVPAAAAKISPARSIVSAFHRPEDTGLRYGKLGQELSTLQAAMDLLGEHSLFLFEQPISGSSPRECCLLSLEILCILKAKRCRGIWATHLPELLRNAKGINYALDGSVVHLISV